MSDPGFAAGAHGLLWVEGEDAVSFLDGQLSQDVAGMEPGEVRRTLLLEPRGKLRAMAWLLRDTGSVGLLHWVEEGEAIRAELERYLFRVDARFRTDDRPLSSVFGEPAQTPGWDDAGDRLDVRLPGRAPSAVTTTEPDLPVLSADEIALHRVRGGEPRMGVDVGEDTIPQESGLVPEAVSFTKGCYLGQELVARIDSRGHVNRHLRRLRIVELPQEPESPVRDGDGAEVGALTTVAPTGRGAEALAMLRREVAPGDRVTVDGVDAEVLPLRPGS